MPEEKVESIKGLTLTADGRGAVFDVAAEDLDLFLAGTVSRWLYEFLSIDFLAVTDLLG